MTRRHPSSPGRDSGLASRDGMTLVEVMIAVAIIGIAFVALAFSQVLGFRVTRVSQQTQIARDLATLQMETIRSNGFASYKDCDGSDSAPSDCSGKVASSDYSDFTVSWDMDNSPPGMAAVSAPALVAVTVSVTWHDQEYALTNYLSCGDPDDESSTTVPCPGETLIAAGGGGGGGAGVPTSEPQ